METTLSILQSKITGADAVLSAEKARLSSLEEYEQDLLQYQGSVDKSIALLQRIARDTQMQLRYQLEDVVQLAIDACFPDEYTFRVEFELKRGRTEARIFLLKDGFEVDPMTDNGGGLVDLTSFALRFSAWSLSKTAPVIILDEPFKFLDKERKVLAFNILKELSQKLGLQIISVTHEQELLDIADRVLTIKQKDGVSFLEEFHDAEANYGK